MGKVYFVSGIDTDAGKSYATGILARNLGAKGKNVMTMKLIQTGCPAGEVSEDIQIHRRLMGLPLLPGDLDHTTCPVRLLYPASPDLAARMEGKEIDMETIRRSIEKLSAACDILLVEGAGGLMVPIRGEYTMIDFAVEYALPVILVTNPRLGSVSHTLLSLAACREREVEVSILAYNLWGETSPEITADTRSYLKAWIACHHPGCQFEEIPPLKE